MECLQTTGDLPDTALNQLSKAVQQEITEKLQNWQVQPNGTEGYRTAEVTLGGVDTQALSSKTMEARDVRDSILSAK